MEPFVPGAVIDGRWRVVAVARDGDVSLRYQAVTCDSAEPVSIVQTRIPAEARAHVEAMASAWRALRVAGVPRIVDVRLDGDAVLVVSEAAEGKTLSARLEAREEPFDEVALLGLAESLCRILEALHAGGVVCGAVAPDTVVVTPQTALLELDVARTLRGLARGRPMEASVDVHGLGRVLYCAATGVTPPDLRHGIEESRPLEPMHRVNEAVSARTERTVKQMLSFEPSRRQASIAAVRTQLGLAQGTSPGPAAPAPAAPAPAAPAPVAPAPVAPAPVAPAPATPSGASRPAVRRPLSHGPAAIALVTFLFMSAAWVARLLYVVSDEVRVRVDPRSKPPAARPRIRIAAPRTPYPTTLTGSDGTVMLLVPEGEFPRGVPDPDQDDGPQITETLDACYVDRTEVTAAQFARFVQLTGWVARGPWRRYVNPERMDLPVAGVTAEDAEEYARWLGKRLPTEEEWEKAARGAKGRTWPWGDRPPEPGVAALYAATGDTQTGVLPVGSCPQGASPCGALDMAGNVWEWTTSTYAPYSGSRAHEALFGAGLRVVRGGSWNVPLALARTTTRMPMPARLWAPDVGFRCVLPLHP